MDTFKQLGDVIREMTFQREWDQFRYGKPQSPWRPAKCPEDEGQFEAWLAVGMHGKDGR